MATNKKREILLRAYVSFAFVLLLGAAILGRAFYIQTAHGDYYRALADSLTISAKPILAERGNIYSDDGRLLAATLPRYDIRIDFKTTYLHPDTFFKYVDAFAVEMSKKYPEKTTAQYKAELMHQRKKKSRSYLLKRNVSYNDLIEMKQWPLFNKGPYISGIREFREDLRKNPFDMLAKRTLGGMNDSFGIYGLEKQYDSILRGKEGTIMVQRISGGAVVPIDSKEEIAAQPGHDIYTTINVELQDVAEEALRSKLKYHEAEHGCVVLMEVKTGRIKAMANLGLVKDSTYGEIQNYAIWEAADPGSTFKLATVASLIEDGYVTNNTKVYVGNGQLVLDKKSGKPIVDHAVEAPEITLKRAFEESSNVAMASLAHKYYAVSREKFYNHFKDFGFTQKINIELPGAAMPTVPVPKNWSGISAAYMAHGYGIDVTPLHILMFYNAVANNGVMVQPHVVEKVKSYNRTIDSTQTIVLNEKICSDKTLAQLHELLVAVVENGTATNLKTDYLHVAGKTGTAVISQGKKGYSVEGNKVYRASFCGYFPAEDPQYSMIVVVNSPNANGYYGNKVAGTIFKEVADKVYSLNLSLHKSVNGVPIANTTYPLISKGYTEDLKNIYAHINKKINVPESEWSQVTATSNKLLLAENSISYQTVPDVVGMSMKDAVYLLESLGLRVSANGKGNVFAQTGAGEKVIKGSVVNIQLR